MALGTPEVRIEAILAVRMAQTTQKVQEVRKEEILLRTKSISFSRVPEAVELQELKLIQAQFRKKYFIRVPVQ